MGASPKILWEGQESRIRAHVAPFFDVYQRHADKAFKTQLLKWVGNKQRVAPAIIKCFPERFRMYHEPFLGSGGVLGVLAPRRAFGTDGFKSLIEIWQALADQPRDLKAWYEDRWKFFKSGEKVTQFEAIKARYNRQPNAPDLLFIARSCYGGVVRFRMKDAGISTPCGAHDPISPESFASRVDLWHTRVGHTKFECLDFREAIARARAGDLVYCDPPYVDTQAILYGAQSLRNRTAAAVRTRAYRLKLHTRRTCNKFLYEGLQVSQELSDKIRINSSALGITKAEYIRRAVERYVEAG